MRISAGKEAVIAVLDAGYSLSPVSEGTRVDITAENVPIGITRADHEAGFAATLDNLAAFVEER